MCKTYENHGNIICRKALFFKTFNNRVALISANFPLIPGLVVGCGCTAEKRAGKLRTFHPPDAMAALGAEDATDDNSASSYSSYDESATSSGDSDSEERQILEEVGSRPLASDSCVRPKD